MAYITGLTTKGRVTIPKAIRDELGLQPFDKIHFTLEDGEDGLVKLEKVSPGDGDSASCEKDSKAAFTAARRLEP